MKYRYVTMVLVLGALLGHAGQIHAQRPTIVRPPQKSPEERYEDMKKSPFLAATLELIIPTLGHDYAGDRDAGKPMAGLMIVGGGMLMLAIAKAAADFYGRADPAHLQGEDGDTDPDSDSGSGGVSALAKTGMVAIAGSRVWAFVSAWRVANRTNAHYRSLLNLDDAGLALSVTPSGQLGLGVSLRF